MQLQPAYVNTLRMKLPWQCNAAKRWSAIHCISFISIIETARILENSQRACSESGPPMDVSKLNLHQLKPTLSASPGQKSQDSDRLQRVGLRIGVNLRQLFLLDMQAGLVTLRL